MPGSDQAETEAQPTAESEKESEKDNKKDDQAGTSGPLPEGWSLRVDDISLTDDLIQWQQSGLAVTVELSELSTGLFNSASDDAAWTEAWAACIRGRVARLRSAIPAATSVAWACDHRAVAQVVCV